MLVLEDIVKRFGTHLALDGVSMEVPQGKVFGLLGPNGAGKTTLIRIITRITGPDSGKVLLQRHRDDGCGRVEAWATCRRNAACTRR
jgi:ABC-2 type transport system ATP-binding protein